MATSVAPKKEKVVLQDGTVVELRALNIKNLRSFMEVVKKFEGAKEDSEGLDLMIDACQIALKTFDEEKFEDRDYLEDVLDIENIARIMKIAGGVDINQDPNL